MIKKFFFCLVCILFVSCTPKRYTDEFTQISKENLLGRWSCLDTWSSNENYDKHLITLHFQDNNPLSIWKSEKAIGIDCGCGYEYGRLGCLRLDDMKEFYSDEDEEEAD